jgi:Zn-dependent protease with chaperone function
MLQKMNACVEHSPIEWLEKRPVLGHLMTINGLSRSVMNDFFLTQPTIKSRIEHLMALE